MKLIVSISLLLIIFNQAQSSDSKDFEFAREYFLDTIRLANAGELDKVRARFFDHFVVHHPRGKYSLEKFIEYLRGANATLIPVPTHVDTNDHEYVTDPNVVVLSFSMPDLGEEYDFELEGVIDREKNEMKFSSATVYL
ncbi:unnamed protein product [Caenorhabditis angaria]|uniref:Nuclear transport factor 2 family protein n=1 Tax=Caenorhabditis angaria TaxID=860376 RepID=A0A9P1N1B1_9PELO|nr:unnamed protein product [Caenorhabditis angaria]